MIRLSIGFLLFSLLISCQEKNNEKVEKKTPKRGGIYGSCFRFSVPTTIHRFFPYSSASLYEQQLASLCFEPLFKVNEYGSYEGVVASNYIFIPDSSLLRISIKKNVRFHDHPVFQNKPHFVSVEDVAFSIAFGCSSNPNNLFSSLFKNKIFGAETFYKKTIKKPLQFDAFEGIRVLNDSTVDLKLLCGAEQALALLSNTSISILSFYAFSSLSEKDFLTSAIGTGPFQKPQFTKNRVSLYRNPLYYCQDESGNQLPFFDSVIVSFNVNQIQAFEQGNIDLIQNVTSKDLETLFGTLEKAQMGQNLPHKTHIVKNNELCFLVFNESHPPFNSVLTRKTVALSLNRNLLVDNINEGLVPLFGFYQDTVIESPDAVVRQVNSVFPLGFVFSPKKTYKDSLLNDLIYNQIKAVVSNLNFQIPMAIDSLFSSFPSKTMSIFKLHWVPESSNNNGFLDLFYSQSDFAKLFGIVDRDFDQLYIETIKSDNLELKRQMAEKILLEKQHFVPLYSSDMIFISNLELRNFKITSSGLFDLAKVFKKPVMSLVD